MNTTIVPHLTEQQTMALAQCFQLAISTSAMSMALDTLERDARISGMQKEFAIVCKLAREAAEHAAQLQDILWREYRIEEPAPEVANDE